MVAQREPGIVVEPLPDSRAAEDHVGEMIRKGHPFERLRPEVIRGQSGGQQSGKPASGLDGFGVRVHAEDLIAVSKKVSKVSAGTAARVEDFHARGDAPAKKLIEQIDIDRTELFQK